MLVDVVVQTPDFFCSWLSIGHSTERSCCWKRRQWRYGDVKRSLVDLLNQLRKRRPFGNVELGGEVRLYLSLRDRMTLANPLTLQSFSFLRYEVEIT